MPSESLKQFPNFLGAKLFLVEQVALQARMSHPDNKVLKDVTDDILKICHGKYGEIVEMMGGNGKS